MEFGSKENSAGSPRPDELCVDDNSEIGIISKYNFREEMMVACAPGVLVKGNDVSPNSAERPTPDERCVDHNSEIAITIKDDFKMDRFDLSCFAKCKDCIKGIVSPLKWNHKTGCAAGVPVKGNDPSSKCSIYRIPGNMREVDKNAYEPKLVSIGPFHHKSTHLQGMESHKLRFLCHLLRSSGHQNGTTKSLTELDQIDFGARIERLGRLGEDIEKLEAKARACYSEKFDNIKSSEFVWMMILDGCFIVKLLLLYAAQMSESNRQRCIDDPIFTTRWMLPTLQLDLLMLENQLPLFVLQEIFEITKTEETLTDLKDLTFQFFVPLMPGKKKILEEKHKVKEGEPDHLPGKKKILEEKDKVKEGKPDHFLDLFHSKFISPLEGKMCKGKTIDTDRRFIYCATELEERGVVIKQRKDHDLLDIKFERGVLKIPPLFIEDRTASVFLNFVAYEQCNRAVKAHFTDYVLFFDNLVNSAKDVELLHYSGIINHGMSRNEDVADLFNKLGKEIFFDVHKCYLYDELEGVSEYSNTDWNMWRAKLMHDYFSNPWAFLSLFAAIVILALTIGQTIFSILSYIHPPS